MAWSISAPRHLFLYFLWKLWLIFLVMYMYLCIRIAVWLLNTDYSLVWQIFLHLYLYLFPLGLCNITELHSVTLMTTLCSIFLWFWFDWVFYYLGCKIFVFIELLSWQCFIKKTYIWQWAES
jgi:hypothetical protein